MYYTSQRAYTNIVWEKLEEENYETLLKENPFKHSIVGDIAAAANAHRNRDSSWTHFQHPIFAPTILNIGHFQLTGFSVSAVFTLDKFFDDKSFERWQLAYLGFVIFFTLIKFMKILSGTHFFEMTKGTYFKVKFLHRIFNTGSELKKSRNFQKSLLYII